MPDTAGPDGSGRAGRRRHAAPDDAGRPPVLPRAPRRARHRDRSAGPGPAARGAALALLLAALVVAGAVLLPGLTGDGRGDGSGGAGAGGGTSPGGAAPSSGAAGPAVAPADWLAAALPPSADLAAPADVREDLVGQGVPAGRLRAAEDGPAPGGLLAVAGPAPPGSRVVARFETPGGGPLLVVDPAPVEPTPEQRERRRSLAAALLANPMTGDDPGVAAVLQSGEVDLRLLSLLAALAAGEGVGIAAFPPLPGEEEGTTPARRVLLDAVGGAPLPGDPAATDRLRTVLEAQLPPFRPDDVQVTDDGVLVTFHYASAPDDLVTRATP